MSVNKYRLKGMPPRAMAFSGKPEAREPSVMEAEKTLSDAYLRLRAIIPGAFDTPYGPSPEVVWQVTEKAAERLKARAESAELALRLIIEEWNSQGRLVDTFISDRMNAVIDNAVFVLTLKYEPQNV